MSLWLERRNELARYEDFRREAEQNQLARHGKKGYQKILKVLQRRQQAWGVPGGLVVQPEPHERNTANSKWPIQPSCRVSHL